MGGRNGKKQQAKKLESKEKRKRSGPWKKPENKIGRELRGIVFGGAESRGAGPGCRLTKPKLARGKTTLADSPGGRWSNASAGSTLVKMAGIITKRLREKEGWARAC